MQHIACALLALGVEVQERIAIFANNSMAWSLADLAILELRAVSVPLYATNTPAQAAFIINDADIRILFVGEQEQLDAAIALRGVCPQLTHIIVFDASADLRDCEIAQHLHHFERLADIERFESPASAKNCRARFAGFIHPYLHLRHHRGAERRDA